LSEATVSHDPSEIILICRYVAQEKLLVITTVENSFAALLLCKLIFSPELFDEA